MTLLALVLPRAPAAAQVGPVDAVARPDDGRIIVRETPINPVQVTPVGVRPKPEITERAIVDPAVRRKIEEFGRAAEAFDRRIAELKKRLEGARTEEDKKKIRELIRLEINAWRDASRQNADGTRERNSELRREFPKRREALEEGRGGLLDARPRRPGAD